MPPTIPRFSQPVPDVEMAVNPPCPQGLPASCDLFCRVIDNFGDAGVCGRLARQLAGEYGLLTRLWIDRPEVLAELRLAPVAGLEVLAWPEEGGQPWQPADLVIEAFACELPDGYLGAMATRSAGAPAWINLEYLSDEAWTRDCHGLPSPHPRLPLTRHFYFPGPDTGGLIREAGLLAARDAFRADPVARATFLRGLGLPVPAGPAPRRVSLFAYENPQLAGLLTVWSQEDMDLLVPEGRVLASLAEALRERSVTVDNLRAGSQFRLGRCRVWVLPFLSQADYDRLLWACDFNFVRGEDSLVRALWAGVPFAWHIYRQHEDAHLDKLEALLARVRVGLPAAAGDALAALWRGWNQPVASDASGQAWRDCLAHWPALADGAASLSAGLGAEPDLVTRLLQFCVHRRAGNG